MLSPPHMGGYFMEIEETLSEIESANTFDELSSIMQKVAEQYDFCAYNFIDAGRPSVDEPFWSGTTGKNWESDYLSNGLVHVDPTLHLARKLNVPFYWGDIPIQSPRGPKSGARLTMDAARDHGFNDGLVVPLHVVDPIGRRRSACLGFFWSVPKKLPPRKESKIIIELHTKSLYWMQKAIDLVSDAFRESGNVISNETSPDLLTDREKESLCWAGRGKTTPEVAEIFGVRENTAAGYMKNACHKLDASTKTHAVTKAIYLGLIDI